MYPALHASATPDGGARPANTGRSGGPEGVARTLQRIAHLNSGAASPGCASDLCKHGVGRVLDRMNAGFQGAIQMDENTFSVGKTSDAQIGDDPKFENTWSRFARLTWVLLAVFTALGGAGLFGRGPLAHATAGAPAGPLYVR
ncbi:MAG: hypothetical protein ACR2JE_01390 [Acidobacteriaceae bacterium]